MADLIDIKIGSVKTTALVARPGRPTGAGVVVTFHRGGLDDITKWMVDAVAAAGFAAIAPNHYHALPPGADIEERTKYLSDEQMTADLKAGVDWLLGQGGAERHRLGLVGTCMGGRTTLVGVETLADAWRCGCIWYGGNSNKKLTGKLAPPATAERLGHIACPLIGFFGNEDQNPSPADVDQLDALLTKLGKDHVFHRYDGAGHGFLNRFASDRYRQSQAEDTWSKAMDFLHRHLSVRSPVV